MVSHKASISGMKAQLTEEMSLKTYLYSIGNPTVLWNKIMNEVKLGRYAGPFDKIPYQNYMQSLIGLVPKSGNKARLIFHLSYEFKRGLGLLNSNTPKEKCTVKYKDLDHAIQICIDLMKSLPSDQPIYFSKSDIISAFRLLPLRIANFCWTIMKAVNPISGRTYYFVDKCLPFGASISCVLFQQFSDALQHLTEFAINRNVRRVLSNYLDDFLFIALTLMACNNHVLMFMKICDEINCPVSSEKTEWGSTIITFLGILLDGVYKCLRIPIDKRDKALNLLQMFIHKNKATIKQIQQLTGTLNFLSRAIVPGRAFTRHMYARINLKDNKGRKLKEYHHVKIDQEFKNDCSVWFTFLMEDKAIVLNRPLLDLNRFETSRTLKFYSDASGKIGFGAVYNKKWLFGVWSKQFLQKKPSIEYLELYALCCALISWETDLMNCRIIIFCDNQAVVEMVNNTTSGCPNCMILIRLLVINNLKFNRRVSVRFVPTKLNDLADSLSRQQFDRFRRLAPDMDLYPTKPNNAIWPVEKLWVNKFGINKFWCKFKFIHNKPSIFQHSTKRKRRR